jgi:hypothetical protein
MTETFIKKYWDEGDVLYYLHFTGNDAIRQIEITEDNKVYLDIDEPVQALYIYDQNLEDLELDEEDFISKKEFDEAWRGSI